MGQNRTHGQTDTFKLYGLVSLPKVGNPGFCLLGFRKVVLAQTLPALQLEAKTPDRGLGLLA